MKSYLIEIYLWTLLLFLFLTFLRGPDFQLFVPCHSLLSVGPGSNTLLNKILACGLGFSVPIILTNVSFSPVHTVFYALALLDV